MAAGIAKRIVLPRLRLHVGRANRRASMGNSVSGKEIVLARAHAFRPRVAPAGRQKSCRNSDTRGNRPEIPIRGHRPTAVTSAIYLALALRSHFRFACFSVSCCAGRCNRGRAVSCYRSNSHARVLKSPSAGRQCLDNDENVNFVGEIDRSWPVLFLQDSKKVERTKRVTIGAVPVN